MCNIKTAIELLDKMKKFLEIMNDQDMLEKYFGKDVDELLEIFDGNESNIETFLITIMDSFYGSADRDRKIACSLFIWHTINTLIE